MTNARTPIFAASVLCSASLVLWGQQFAPSIQKDGTKAVQPAGPITSAPVSEAKKLDDAILFLRSRYSHEYAIGAKGIDEAMYVPIGGIDQWITIRGQDRHNPVLLFLHGGPGDVTNPWSFPYFATWENYFTVVQWDQRGSGRTLKKTGPSVTSSMTLDRMTRDGIAVSEFLRKHLGKRNIVVVGHSFGSLLGVRMVRERPDLYSAYVGTGQVATETGYLEADYRALVQKAQNAKSLEAQADLRRIGPPPFKYGSDGFYVLHKWSNLFEGANAFLGGEMGLALISPAENSLEDLNDWMQGQILNADQLWSQMKTLTQKDLGYEFHVPMFFFQGTEDFTSPTELAKEYMNAITAPQKAFVRIEGGHFVVFMHSDVFLHELIARVLPLAQDKEKG